MELNNKTMLPYLGLGTFTIHSADLFLQAIDCGYELFDTAWKYGNESELGKALINSQKICCTISKIHSYQFNGRRRFFYLNRKSVADCWKQSNKRLQNNGPTILLLHSLFDNYLDAYCQLINLYENNCVSAIGVCNCDSIEQLKSIKNKCGQYPMINQIEIHPLRSQTELVDFCHEHEISVIARSPFAHGKVLTPNILNLEKLCQCYGKSVPQLILRWLIQRNITAIPRTSNVLHLKENIDIFDFELSDSDMQIINNLDKNMSFGCI